MQDVTQADSVNFRDEQIHIDLPNKMQDMDFALADKMAMNVEVDQDSNAMHIENTSI